MTSAPAPTPRPAGHALVEALLAQGATTAFGVPGESFLAVLDGFHEHRDRIRFIACRQEGGAAFMAEAQGKLTGRPGICFCTRGPGATNASIGVHTAFQDSTPMILFVGQVASDQRDREAFQEVDYRQMLGPGTPNAVSTPCATRASTSAWPARREEAVDVISRVCLARRGPRAHRGQGSTGCR